MDYKAWMKKFADAMEKTVFSIKGEEVSAEEAFSVLLDYTNKLRSNDRTMHLAGNGASAAMASHYAVDFWKNGKVKAGTFHDISQITAISNDLSYEDVFSFPLSMFGKEGDMFVGISSSGNSENVVRAAKYAQENGIFVVSFSGFKPDNRLRAASDLAIYVPGDTYGYVESAHSVLLHYWIDITLAALEKM